MLLATFSFPFMTTSARAPKAPPLFGLPPAALSRPAPDEPVRLLLLGFRGAPVNAASGWPLGIGSAPRNKKPFSPPVAPVFILDRALTLEERKKLRAATEKAYREWAQVRHRRQRSPYARIDRIHLYEPKEFKMAECELMVFDCLARTCRAPGNRRREPFGVRRRKSKRSGNSRSAAITNRGHTLRSATGVSPNLRAEKRARRAESPNPSARPKAMREKPQRNGFLTPCPSREFKHEPRGVQPGVPVFARTSLLAARWRKRHKSSAFAQERLHRWVQADQRGRLTALKRALTAMGVGFHAWEGDSIPQAFKDAEGLSRCAGFVRSQQVSWAINEALIEINNKPEGMPEKSAGTEPSKSLPAQGNANSSERAQARRL